MAATETTSFLELRRLAEQGTPRTNSPSAVRYDEGEGVPEDRQEAVKWCARLPSRDTPMPNSPSMTRR